MKHKFRIIVGMLLLAIPLCMNAQVKPVKPQQNPQKNEAEIKEKQEAEKIRIEQEKLNKPQSDIKPQVKPVEQHQAKPAETPEKPERTNRNSVITLSFPALPKPCTKPT